jgi:membrane-bound ClpP family serine protease
MDILMALFILGGIFMIADQVSPTFRIILQISCSVVLGVVIAFYIAFKLKKEEKSDG